MFNRDLPIRPPHNTRKLLPPLHQHQRIRLLRHLLQPQCQQLPPRLQPIKIEMIEPHLGPHILMHQRKRRTRHIRSLRRTQRRRNSLHQRRLPRAQISPQHNQLRSRQQHLSHPLSHRQCPCHTPRLEPLLLHPRRPQIHVNPSSSVTRYRNASERCVTVSVATTVCSSIARTAKSPASPCRYTAVSTARATSPGNCASIPATIPVKISPLPPFAIAGFPLVFTAIEPSGCATSVRHPFNTSVSLCSVANRRASPTPSASTSFTVNPASRAISPGCGVNTITRPVPSSSSVLPPNAFKASASITIGSLVFSTNCRANSDASPSVDNPGPTASTVIFFSRLSSLAASRLRTEHAPSSPAASGAIISSGAIPATIFTMLSGTAAVTRPAPARSAASEAIAGAPAFP